MSTQDMRRLLEEVQPDEKGTPFLWYAVSLLMPLCFPLLFLAFIYIALPPDPVTSVPWLRPLVTGALLLLGALLLASVVLLVLIATRFRGGVVGKIVTGVVVAGWLAWVLLLLLLTVRPNLGELSLADLAPVWAIVIPLLVAYPVFQLGLYLAAPFLVPIEERSIYRVHLLKRVGYHLRRGQLRGAYSEFRHYVSESPRSKVYRFLNDYIRGWNFPCYVVTDERREEDKVVQRIKGNPFSQLTRGPGFIISDCDHAVAVTDGVKFKGAQGPGVIFTGFGDRPLRTLDLRPQLRTATPVGLTQDGIEAKVLIFAPFQLERSGQKLKPGEPFPYRRGAAFKAVHRQKMEHPNSGEPTQQLAWDELPTIIGTRIMQNILSGYRFDELYGPYDDIEGTLPRVRISGEYLDQLRTELKPLGIQVVGGGISNLLPAKDEILKQRVRTWRADWTRQVMLKQAQGQAERIRRIEQARMEAQRDLILALGERLAALDRPGVEATPTEIVPEFLRVLEEVALRPMVRRYLPQDTVRDVRRLREGLEE
jgi:hypothetical protein